MRKSIKSILSIVLTLSLTLLLFSCGKDNGNVDVTDITETNAPVITSAEPITYDASVSPEFEFIDVEGGVYITAYNGNAQKVVVPESNDGKPVIGIDRQAFMGNKNIKEIVLPDTIKLIGYSSFYQCTSLEVINFPEGLEVVSQQSFAHCKSLKAVVLPSTLKTLGIGSFGSCYSLETVSMEKTQLESIPEFAFQSAAIKTVVIPETVTLIDNNAFDGCAKLESAYIPASVTEIVISAFDRNDTIVIYAPAGSCAETYAGNREIAFKAQ